MLRPMSRNATPFSDGPEQCAASWLAAWDAQGIHRTATAGDNAGADWLAAEAEALGAKPVIEEFSLDRLDPEDAFLEIGSERIAGAPVFDAPPDADGIAGRIGPPGSGAEIVCAELGPRDVYSGEAARLRRTAGHRGLIILCAGESPGLALLNAEQFRHPYGTPAIHMASEAGAALRAAMAAGATVRLVAASRRTPARGRNVVVSLAGARGSGPPLVVMTPRSSWWQSVAERGGGIVCWLESLRAVLAARPGRPVVFTANSGHELGHLGLDDFVARRPGWDRPVPQGGATWVHYGANIGAAGGTLSLVSPDDDLRQLAAAELTAAGEPPATLAPKSLVPSGETRDIHRAGGRYLTLVGSNRWFHLPQDRWPGTVDVAAITRIAQAAVRIALAATQ